MAASAAPAAASLCPECAGLASENGHATTCTSDPAHHGGWRDPRDVRIAQLEAQVATLRQRDEWLVLNRERLVADDLRRLGVQ